MLIAGVDFETTGLSPVDNRIIEVGCVLWDTERATPVQFYHDFVDPEEPISQEISGITNITQDMINDYSVRQEMAVLKTCDFLSRADFVLAHNAPFDREFLQESCHRLAIAPPKKVWINSVTDVPYPEKIATRKLTHLAAEHGFVNPFAHRALTDVLTMLRLVDKYNWQEIAALAAEPNVVIKAEGGYAIKDLAKASGFYYNPDKKAWFKNIKESKLQAEREKCQLKGFAVSEVME